MGEDARLTDRTPLAPGPTPEKSRKSVSTAVPREPSKEKAQVCLQLEKMGRKTAFLEKSGFPLESGLVLCLCAVEDAPLEIPAGASHVFEEYSLGLRGSRHNLRCPLGCHPRDVRSQVTDSGFLPPCCIVALQRPACTEPGAAPGCRPSVKPPQRSASRQQPHR